ncbi:hypothetical protein [Alicyclobacillus sacchari]|uniref:hypothetical protein n=1 Tax=Alicyclobacillus sacchari TaxID=392010 RepID=UPI0024E14061|nr:hypothetical protein [Alicyclobacillus sacchari]
MSHDVANSVLMRLTFATQLIVELLMHNKTVGGIAACVAGVSATVDDAIRPPRGVFRACDERVHGSVDGDFPD